MQLQLDEKAKVEVFDKRVLAMAKGVAGGIKEQYGREFDWAVLQHNLRDAFTLAREDIPAELKPKVKPERAVWLQKLRVAAQAFDIPKVVELMDISLANIYNDNMSSTGLELYRARQKKLPKPMNSAQYNETLRADMKRLTTVQEDPVKVIKSAQERRQRALLSLQRSFRYHKEIHQRTMLGIREVFLVESGGTDTMTREQFATSMYRLGLGMSQEDVAEVLHAIDPHALDRIDFDLVLFLCRVGAEINEKEVPERPTPKQRRRHEKGESLDISSARLN